MIGNASDTARVIWQEKTHVRGVVREQRERLTDRALRSEQVAERLLALQEVQQAKVVFIYASIGSEVATEKIVERLFALGKVVAMPLVVDEGRMLPMILDRPGNLIAGEYGIPAPVGSEPLETVPDLTLVPGIAFTVHGDRLGQGGGFYDRYLARTPETFAIGLCFECQLLDELPTTELDNRMDMLVTEQRTIHCSDS